MSADEFDKSRVDAREKVRPCPQIVRDADVNVCTCWRRYGTFFPPSVFSPIRVGLSPTRFPVNRLCSFSRLTVIRLSGFRKTYFHTHSSNDNSTRVWYKLLFDREYTDKRGEKQLKGNQPTVGTCGCQEFYLELIRFIHYVLNFN